MGNQMQAHIFKRKKIGEREEVILKLFYPDGTPCDLEAMEGGGGGSSAGQLHYAGDWLEDVNYTAGAIVTWYNGEADAYGLYLTTDDVVGGDPTSWVRLAETVEITGMMRWQGSWTEFDGVHPSGHVVLHNGALWMSLGDAAGEPGVDPLWDVILPASMFNGGGMSWRGVHNPTQNYVVGDVVQGPYVCIEDHTADVIAEPEHTNVTPSWAGTLVPSWWAVNAEPHDVIFDENTPTLPNNSGYRYVVGEFELNDTSYVTIEAPGATSEEIRIYDANGADVITMFHNEDDPTPHQTANALSPGHYYPTVFRAAGLAPTNFQVVVSSSAIVPMGPVVDLATDPHWESMVTPPA